MIKKAMRHSKGPGVKEIWRRISSIKGFLDGEITSKLTPPPKIAKSVQIFVPNLYPPHQLKTTTTYKSTI